MVRTMLAAAVVALGGYSALAGGLFCAVSGIPSGEVQEAYINNLRNRGPAGLSEALARYDQFVETAGAMGVDLTGPQPVGSDPEQCRVAADGQSQLAEIVDRVAGQRGATASRLFWYTDLDDAKAAASESGKPILSLRMLGKLTDEYSCANSRFFRTTLYTNAEISSYLRDHFVLHWQSVRPVPRVTIDFGDGRKLERTLTGNSAHYVLDASGRPLDVLPGLYGPQAFRQWLDESATLARRWADSGNDLGREMLLGQYHLDCWQTIDKAMRADMAAFAPELLPQAATQTPASFASKSASAFAAGNRAVSKAKVEQPMLAAVLPAADVLEERSPDFWTKVGAAHAALAQLDAASIDAIRRQNPTARAAGALSPSKRAVEDPVLRLVRTFQDSIAVDTMRNEYTLHQTVHQWFAEGKAGSDFDALNELVYAELFLTPSSDPWLGLAPEDVYTALDGGGLAAAQ